MRKTLTLTGIAGLALSSSLMAIERPTPVEAPKESGVEVQAPDKKEPVEMPKAKNEAGAAWLGVAGSPVSETLSSHLGTEAGLGITLDIVSPESPAAKAGLSAHDVITKFGGVELHGMEDLRNEISKHKSGDEVEVDIISRGKERKLKVTLGARPDGIRMPFPGQQPDANGGLRIQLGQMPEGMFKGLDDAERLKIEQLMQNQMKQMQKEMQLLELDMGNMQLKPGDKGNVQRFELNLQDFMKEGNARFSGSITKADEHGSVSLKMTENGKEVEVKDLNGKLLFAGPYESEVDREAVPDDIRERIDQLGVENFMDKGRLKLRFNHDGQPLPGEDE